MPAIRSIVYHVSVKCSKDGKRTNKVELSPCVSLKNKCHLSSFIRTCQRRKRIYDKVYLHH